MRSEMNFVTAEQLAEMMGISEGHAYKIIHVLNEELQAKGFLTVSGRVPRKYLEKRCYGIGIEEVTA